MHAPHIIARLLGPLLTTVGIGMLTNTETYRVIGQQFLSTYAIIYLYGIIILSFGLAILNVHNAWTADWRSLITPSAGSSPRPAFGASSLRNWCPSSAARSLAIAAFSPAPASCCWRSAASSRSRAT
jgi:hypothetical protein